MKRFILAAAVAAGLFCALPQARATVLAPGQSGTPASMPSMPAGSILASGVQTLSSPTDPDSGNPYYTATVRYAVYKETATGTLDFLYQVLNGSSSEDSLGSLRNSSFARYTTDVYNTAASNFTIDPKNVFSGGTVTSNTAARSGTTNNGKIVTFDFSLNSRQATHVLVI